MKHLSMSHRAFQQTIANPSSINTHPRIYQQNLRPQDFISYIPVWNSHRRFRQTYPEPTPQDTPSNPLIMQWGALNVECIVSCVTFLICVSSMSHHECLWNRKLKKWHVRASMDLLCPTRSLGWKLAGLTYHQNNMFSFFLAEIL